MSKFGSGHQESIITKKKGKLDLNEPLHFVTSSWKGMKPSTDKYYWVKDLTIYKTVQIEIGLSEYGRNKKAVQTEGLLARHQNWENIKTIFFPHDTLKEGGAR